MEKEQYAENARKIIDLVDGMTDTQWARVQHLIANCLSEKKAKAYRIFFINGEGKLQEDRTKSNIKISHSFFRLLVDQQTQYMLSGHGGFVKSDIPELQTELDAYFNDNESFRAELNGLISGTVAKGWEYMYAYKDENDRTAFQVADSIGVVEVRKKETDDGCPFSIPQIMEGGNAMPKKAPEKIGSVLRVPLSQLHPHPQNPFAVRDDPAMQELKESVSQNGVLVPAIAHPRAEGGYELIAGHRRKYACEQAGQEFMPVIVLNLNDDEAVIQLVDSNIQREDILPSERARAYKMKMDAIKRQGAKTDLTSPNVSAKFRSDDTVGEKDGISGDTVRNYISLNNLTPPLMQMVDEKKIALTPAYQLAALSEQEQELLVETMSSEQATPSLSQAQRMKKLSQSGELNEDTMLSIMMEQKKPVKNDIVLPGEKLRKYFPRSYSPEKIQDTIFKLLDAWMRKRQHDKSR